MKILLVCAGGYSTSILVKKIEKWVTENDEEIEIDAIGTTAVEERWHDYDVILTGPQISYKVEQIEELVEIPVRKISPLDYGVGNVENIISLAKK
jgi:PTS system cellobiose-specific IIB component